VLNTVLNPLALFKLNVLYTVGFRISASTNKTRCPDLAKTTAKLAEVVDFPSLGPEDVMTMVLICLSAEDANRKDKNFRKKS